MTKSIIIGAGPAGLSAAVTCAKKGIDVLVIDEYLLAGGRLLGQLYEEPNGSWWNGIKESDKLYQEAIELGVQFKFNTPVVNIETTDDVWTVYTEQKVFTTKHLL